MRKMSTAGFTIVELMIAMSVFSVILLVLVSSMVGIGKIYTKGNVQAETQDVSRQIMNSIAQAIQLNPGQITLPTPDPAHLNPADHTKSTNGIYSFCASTQQYSYQFGQVVDDTHHGLTFNNVPAGCGLTAFNLTSGTELLSNHMRLMNLTLTQPTPTTDPYMYKISVQVAYGDDDLLCSDSVSGSCDPNATLSAAQLSSGMFVHCKSSAGQEFCATSNSSTLVERRMR